MLLPWHLLFGTLLVYNIYLVTIIIYSTKPLLSPFPDSSLPVLRLLEPPFSITVHGEDAFSIVHMIPFFINVFASLSPISHWASWGEGLYLFNPRIFRHETQNMAHGRNLLMLIFFLLHYFIVEFLKDMPMIPSPGSIQEVQSEGMLRGCNSNNCDVTVLLAGMQHCGYLSSAPQNPCVQTSWQVKSPKIEIMVKRKPCFHTCVVSPWGFYTCTLTTSPACWSILVSVDQVKTRKALETKVYTANVALNWESVNLVTSRLPN